MEATAPVPPTPPKKIEPPFLVVYLRKMQNHQASLLPESPLKDFKLPLSWTVSVQHSILNIWLLNTYLQNINWLPASKKMSMYPVYLKEKCLLSQSIYLTYTMFSLTFWKGKCIKIVSWKLWLMWVKVIFTNIHKKSNACVNNFGRDVFTFYWNSCS